VETQALAVNDRFWPDSVEKLISQARTILQANAKVAENPQ
jgi:hypothetical protein